MCASPVGKVSPIGDGEGDGSAVTNDSGGEKMHKRERMFCALNCANVRKWKTFGFGIDFFTKMYYNISERATNVLFRSALMQYGTKNLQK